MAEVQAVFQSNIFQSDITQGKWGRFTFQKNIFQGAYEKDTYQSNVYQDDVFSSIGNITKVFDASELILKILNESISVQTFREKLRSLIKQINETISIGLTGFQSNIYQINVFGSAIKDAYAPLGAVQLVPENIQLSETVSRIKNIKRIINNTINILKSHTSLRSLKRTVSENISIQTFRIKNSQIIKNISDTLNISEGLVRLKSITHTVSESIQLTVDRLFQYNVFQNIFQGGTECVKLMSRTLLSTDSTDTNLDFGSLF